MRFDYTKGQPAKYLVSIYRETSEDFYYFHYFKAAKEFFEAARAKEASGTSISLWDMATDVKKSFVRV